jgi:hypothetical protein
MNDHALWHPGCVWAIRIFAIRRYVMLMIVVSLAVIVCGEVVNGRGGFEGSHDGEGRGG